jgi:hypothetical protein
MIMIAAGKRRVERFTRAGGSVARWSPPLGLGTSTTYSCSRWEGRRGPHFDDCRLGWLPFVSEHVVSLGGFSRLRPSIQTMSIQT